MKFNIQPQDLQAMITHLNSFANDVGGISNRMNSYAVQLESSWRDPQYQGFIGNVQAMSQNFRASQDTLKKMSQTLNVLKQNLERAHADYERMRR